MTRYVLGFIFNDKYDKVLLIHKNRPEWQAGQLNGVGGHVEENETTESAMAREAKEECNLDIPSTEWVPVCTLESINDEWIVYVFRSIDVLENFKNNTDEKCEIVNINKLPKECIHNIPWLIPLCLDNNVSPDRTTISFF